MCCVNFSCAICAMHVIIGGMIRISYLYLFLMFDRRFREMWSRGALPHLQENKKKWRQRSTMTLQFKRPWDWFYVLVPFFVCPNVLREWYWLSGQSQLKLEVTLGNSWHCTNNRGVAVFELCPWCWAGEDSTLGSVHFAVDSSIRVCGPTKQLDW